MTLGGGFLGGTLRKETSKVVGADFHFHIKRQYFQIGAMMSGPKFLSNNHSQVHLGAGIRREKTTSNLAVFAGVSAFTGVLTVADSTYGIIPSYYEGYGVYISAQAIKKFSYDIGAGVEIFGEYSERQKQAGIRLVFFFSGAYRGLKKNYNPNVRTESGS